MSQLIHFDEIALDGGAEIVGKTILSFDIDWAADFVISDLIDIIGSKAIKHTFFVTHTSPLLQKYKENPFVRYGLHPNFDRLLNGDDRNGKNAESVLNNLASCFPSCSVIRSHTLTNSSRLSVMFNRKGFLYESNLLFHNCDQPILPFRDFSELCKVPITWEDDVWLINKDAYKAEEIIQKERLNVFNFHPIHIYLNTPTIEHYDESRECSQNQDELARRRHDGFGVRSIFLSLIERLAADG